MRAILLFAALCSVSCVAQTCEGGATQLYFGNGVLNSFSDAEESSRKLWKFVNSNIDKELLESVQRPLVAYNITEGLLRDLMQATQQKGEEYASRFWVFIRDIKLAPDWFRERAQKSAARVTEHQYINDADFKEQIRLYRKSLAQGDRILVVSHSQGNFYSNSSYEFLNRHESNLGSKFFIVAVATPASHVEGSGPYTTLESDVVIRAVPAHLPPNAANRPAGDFDHGFVDSYLEGNSSSFKIADDLRAVLQNKLASGGRKFWTGSHQDGLRIQPQKVAKQLESLALWIGQIISDHRSNLSDAECLAASAYVSLVSNSNLGCRQRDLAAAQTWVNGCLAMAQKNEHAPDADDWVKCIQFGAKYEAIDFWHLGSVAMATAENYSIVFKNNPQCEWKYSVFRSKMTPALAQAAIVIVAKPPLTQKTR